MFLMKENMTWGSWDSARLKKDGDDDDEDQATQWAVRRIAGRRTMDNYPFVVTGIDVNTFAGHGGGVLAAGTGDDRGRRRWCEVVAAAAGEKALVIERYLGKGGGNSDVEDRLAVAVAAVGAIEKATGGVDHGVAATDKIDGFRNQTDSSNGNGQVALDEVVESGAGYRHDVNVLVVLAGDGHDLQNFPAGDATRCNEAVHVFVAIQAADDSVDLGAHAAGGGFAKNLRIDLGRDGRALGIIAPNGLVGGRVQAVDAQSEPVEAVNEAIQIAGITTAAIGDDHGD